MMNRFIYWVPRILSILLSLFLMVFSLDVFGSGLSPSEIVVALLIHNIPALVMLAVALIAWRREMVGVIGFFVAGVALVLFLLITGRPAEDILLPFLILSCPAFVISSLFLIGWRRKSNRLVSVVY